MYGGPPSNGFQAFGNFCSPENHSEESPGNLVLSLMYSHSLKLWEHAVNSLKRTFAFCYSAQNRFIKNDPIKLLGNFGRCAFVGLFTLGKSRLGFGWDLTQILDISTY